MKDAIIQHIEADLVGSIFVRNDGGYVARFSVNYTLGNVPFTADSGNFTLGENASVPIPDGATDVLVTVQAEALFGKWSTIFTQSFAGPVSNCYKVWGTMFNPKWAEISCS